MAQTDRTFGGSIPQFYDGFLGPLFFLGYAAETAARVAALAPKRVLETACGTGFVTRAMLAALGPDVAIVATDLNQPMLDFASRQEGTAGVDWHQADAQKLPFEDRSFDAVVCQFGVMFFPDRQTGYREARRMLRPDGRFVFSVWDRIEENEFSLLIHDAVAAMFPNDPPGFLTRVPFGYHDVAAVEADLAKAGLKLKKAETVTLRSRAASARDPAVGMCEGSPLRNEIEARDPSRLAEAADAAAASIAARFGAGAVDGKTQAHILTAAPA
jgi:SAM-dependent methyltransferase